MNIPWNWNVYFSHAGYERIEKYPTKLSHLSDMTTGTFD